MAKRRTPITLLPNTGRKGGSGRITQRGSRSIKTGKASAKAKFDVRLDSTGFEVFVDSRDLNAEVGDRILRHLRRSIASDTNPESGQPNPATYQRPNGSWGERNVNTREMANHLTRTITDSNERWGGGRKRISQPTTRMKFYFNDRVYAAINKRDSNRKGNGRAVYLGVGGRVGGLIAKGTGTWLDLAIGGHEFAKDSMSRVRSTR